MATKLDPEAHKLVTIARGQPPEARHRWDATLRGWLAPLTDVMRILARFAPGDRVLDIAPDRSTRAEWGGQRRGLAGLQFRVTDGEHLPLADATCDGVLSRAGLRSFPDWSRALAEMRRVLKPGGRAGMAVYSTPERNALLAVLIATIGRVSRVPSGRPNRTDPFSLGRPGALARGLREAGFADIDVRVVHAPLRLPSAAACVQFERETGGMLHQLVARLPPEAQLTAWDAIGLALRRFESNGVFVAPCEVLVGVGTHRA